jgi:mannose-6-phosphate isomerase-like protein (cupin superfamily)
LQEWNSPEGWVEPGETPEFDEYTVVLKGFDIRDYSFEVREGESIITNTGEWVRYSSHGKDGAEYIAVYLPAFSLESVHRDE